MGEPQRAFLLRRRPRRRAFSNARADQRTCGRTHRVAPLPRQGVEEGGEHRRAGEGRGAPLPHAEVPRQRLLRRREGAGLAPRLGANAIVARAKAAAGARFDDVSSGGVGEDEARERKPFSQPPAEPSERRRRHEHGHHGPRCHDRHDGHDHRNNRDPTQLVATRPIALCIPVHTGLQAKP